MRDTHDSLSKRQRADAYLIVWIITGIGILASSWWMSAWPLVIAMIAVVIYWIAVTSTQHKHERDLERAREAGRIEIEKCKVNRTSYAQLPSTNVIDAQAVQRQPQLPPPPNFMRPKSDTMIQVPTGMRSAQRFIVPEVEPEQGDGVSFDDWPNDIEALRIALRLMQSVTPPTRNNFKAAGMNSGSRYEKIRDWLVGAGLAKDYGDGKTTNWTSDAYNADVHAAIKNYLSLSPTLAG